MKFKTINIITTGFFLLISCSEFIEIEPPRTDLVRETVFSNDKAATAAIYDIYNDMVSAGFASGNGINSFTLLAAFASDDWMNMVNPLSPFQQFSDNELDYRNSLIERMWADLYRYIYKSNAIIEGLENNSAITPELRSQLLGEARFVRAFSHFYLVNLWGDVPLVVSTDYEVNRDLVRTRKEDVYSKIIEDLLASIEMLRSDFVLSANERTRPNRWTAFALLARVYLFTQDWQQAEAAASEVLANGEFFDLTDHPAQVFLKNSRETIWQLHSPFMPGDLLAFNMTSGPSHGILREEFVQSMSTEDLRRDVWIGEFISNDETYYYPTKYTGVSPVTEYSTVLRVSELFLIRAEARAELDDITGAAQDLNRIRGRAGLQETSANSKNELIDDIMHNRRIEFFTEWGHRWLDLKRRSLTADVLGPIKPLTWQKTDELFPIPEIQLLRAPNMSTAQNPGY